MMTKIYIHKPFKKFDKKNKQLLPSLSTQHCHLSHAVEF
jgi:hypothetical protein